MSKRVFVSADWKENESNPTSCDQEVVNRIYQWAKDNRRSIEIDCTDNVHNSVVDKNSSCCRCDIKKECKSHIEWSSVVIVVIGDNTAAKSAGTCDGVSCSPYKSGQNKKSCNKIIEQIFDTSIKDECRMSYVECEIKTALAKRKTIIVVYNSFYQKESWLPSYLKGKAKCYVPFWKKDINGNTQDCYQDIKGYLQ